MPQLYTFRAKVLRVYDADSIHFEVDLGFGVGMGKVKTRLLGVDAPEMGTEEGREARDFVRNLLPVGTEVILQTFKNPGDKYGRWLAKVSFGLNGGAIGDLAEYIIATGHGVAYNGGKRG